MTKTKSQIIKEFRLAVWGIAPKGSLKYKKGKEVEAFITKAFQSGGESEREKIYNKFVKPSSAFRNDVSIMAHEIRAYLEELKED